MDKFDRIYALHGLLSTHKYPVPMTSIIEQLGCKKSSVKRIIRNMRLYLDAPIDYHREHNGYFYNRDKNSAHPYELPGLWFNTSELHALLTAQILLERVEPGLYSEQLAPLKQKIEHILTEAGAADDTAGRRIRILAMANRHFDNSRFRRIASAVLEQKRLNIDYHGRSTAGRSTRTVSPQRLVHYRDNWYLDAWCHLRNDLRTFAVERIEQAHATEQQAREINDETLDAYFTRAYGIFSGPAKHTAVLQFTPERARWVAEEQWHPEQQSRWLDDGSFELHIPYGNPTELVMDILKYGNDVEVVAPASLRNAVKQKIEGMVQLYANRAR